MKEIKKQLNNKEYLEYIEKWKIDNKELVDSNKCRKVFLECLPCGGKFLKITDINWIESCKQQNMIYFIYDNIDGFVEIVNVDKYNLFIKYLDFPIFKIANYTFSKCQFGTMLRKYTSEFKIDIGTIFKDKKRDLTITDKKKIPRYKNDGILKCYDKYYKYKCNKCGFDGGKHWNIKDKEYKDELWAEESNLLKENGVGCACCCSSPSIVVENINSIYKTDNWMTPIINNDEFCKTHTHTTHNKVYPICKDCGRVSKKLISVSNIYTGFECSCSDGISYPNKFAFKMLEELNVKFQSEYSPNWIGQKRFDFYFELDDKEYILEMDGGWHTRDNNMSGQTKEESQYIDNEKERLALEHNIEVIRIDCDYPNLENRFEFIRNNILQNDKLNKLFDLNKIDWKKCYDFTLSNRVKEACNLWNSGIKNIKEISQIMKVNKSTINGYLKQGFSLNWCDYNISKIQKPIIMLTLDGNFIDTFSSNIDIQKKSVKMFGEIFSSAGVYRVARGTRKSYKGYHFKYIEELTEEEYIKYDIENKFKKLEKIKINQAI